MSRSLTPPVAPLTSPALATENPASSPLLTPAILSGADCTGTTLAAPAVGDSDVIGNTNTPPVLVAVAGVPVFVWALATVAIGSPITRLSTPLPRRLGTSANDEPRPVGCVVPAASSKVTMVNPG